MKQHHLLFASLLLSAPLSADELIQHKSRTFFNNSELENVLQNVQVGDDLIVLSDGTRLTGKVPNLPDIPFKFGKFPLKIKDVAAVSFSDRSENTKVQIITHDGYRFVAEVTDQNFPLIQYYPSSTHPTRMTRRELDSKQISYILIRGNSQAVSAKPSHLHVLELNNGDQIPVLIAEESIQLSNGWKEFSINPNEIVDVSFDGGLYGTLSDQRGRKRELDYAFVKDQYIRVQIFNSQQTRGIPWSEVFAIRKQAVSPYQPKNEFIADKNPTQDTQPPLMREMESDQLDSEIVWLENSEPKPFFTEELLDTDIDNIAWIEKTDEIIVADESPEDEQIAMLAAVGEDVQQQWNHHQNQIQGRLSEVAENTVQLNEELKQFKDRNIRLARNNRILQDQADYYKKACQDLLDRQNALVANVELEMTRSYILRQSLHDLYLKWKDAGLESSHFESALREEEQLSNQLQEKIEFISSRLELEMQQKEVIVGSYEQMREDAFAFEKDVSQLSEIVRDRDEVINALKTKNEVFKRAVKEKYRAFETVHNSQKELNSEFLEHVSSLKEKKSQSESARLELQEKVERLQERLSLEKNRSDELGHLVSRLEKEQTEQNNAHSVLYDKMISQIELLSQEKQRAEEKKDTLLASLARIEQQLKVEGEHNAEFEKQYFHVIDELAELREKSALSEAELELKVVKLTAAVNEKQAEVMSLMQQMDIMALNHQDKVNILNQTVEQKMLHIVDLNKSQDSLYSELEMKADRLAIELSDYNNEIKQLNEELASAQRQSKEKEKNAYSLHVKLNAAEETITQLEEDVSQKNFQLEGLNEKLKKVVSVNGDFEHQIQDLTAKLIGKNDELVTFGETHAIQVEGLALQVQQLTSALDKQVFALVYEKQGVEEELVAQLDVLSKTQYALEETSTQYSQACQNFQSRIDHLQQQLHEEKARAVHFEEAFLVSNRELQSFELSNTQLEESLNDAMELLTQLRVELAENKQELSDKSALMEELANAHLDLQDRFGEKITENKVLNKRLNEQETAYSGITQQSSALQEELAVAREALLAKQAETEIQNKINHDLSEQASSLKQRLTQLLPQYELEREKSLHLQQQIQEMSEKVEETTSALRSVKGKENLSTEQVEQLTRENLSLRQEKEALRLQFQQEQSQLREQKSLIARMNQSLNSQKSFLNKIEKSHISLVTELEDARVANTHLIRELNTEKPKKAETKESSLISFKEVHIVAEGENLNNISMKYYQTPHRWTDIFEANRDVIEDVNHVKVGTVLVIPD